MVTQRTTPVEELFADSDAEMMLLSCLITQPRRIKKIAYRLEANHFYRDIYQCMYTIMHAMHQQGRVCTLDTLRYELKRQHRLEEAEGLGKLRDLITMGDTPQSTFQDVEELAETIISEATFRKLAFAATEIMDLAHKRDENALAQAQALISDIVLGADAKPSVEISDAVIEYMQTLEQRRIDLRNNIARGLPTGFVDLDRMIGGLQPAALISLAALTGYGKTSLAWQIVLNVVMNAKRALFFTLEMNIGELVQRALSLEAEVDQKLLDTGEIDGAEYRAVQARAERLKKCDLLMNDNAYSLSEIINHAKKEHAKKPLNLIVVDYIQLVENTTDGRRHETRAEEVAKLSRGLKRLARELNVPVLALAQVNRKVEERPSHEPKLSDLNESGGIARDSDLVLFIYAEEEELQKREQSMPFQVWIKAAKHRNGRMGQIPLYFAPRITKFCDASDTPPAEEE
jgi:replicative DNA helicase